MDQAVAYVNLLLVLCWSSCWAGITLTKKWFLFKR